MDADGAAGKAFGFMALARLAGVDARSLTRENFVERHNPN